jgi:hypothetical protein
MCVHTCAMGAVVTALCRNHTKIIAHKRSSPHLYLGTSKQDDMGGQRASDRKALGREDLLCQVTVRAQEVLWSWRQNLDELLAHSALASH